MPILTRKTIYSRGKRHNRECYHAVLDPNSRALAFLQVDGNRERLMYQPEPSAEPIALTAPGYILAPHFARDLLCWVERVEAKWLLRGAPRERPQPEDAVDLLELDGRPLAVTSCQDLLLWEERRGKQTCIRLSRMTNGKAGTPMTIVGGNGNVYDPACCVDEQGLLHVGYCAFSDGQYRILLQTFNADGSPLGAPVRVSDQANACVYPSVCPAPDGGVWFSYTCFNEGHTGESSFVKHQRFLAQRKFCTTQGTAYVGLLRDGRTFGVFAPVGGKAQQGYAAAGMVHGSRGAGHTQLLTDAAGRVHLLLRRHREAADPVYADSDPPLARAGRRGNENRCNKHPDISLLSLLDSEWSEPACLVRHPHVEAPLTCSRDDRSIRVAFTEDARHTGWNSSGEYFDHDGELGVGVVELELDPAAPPDYELRPFVVPPQPGSSIENPDIDHRDADGYIHAVGQTHTHTNLSICIRERDRCPHLNYRFMQDVQHSDFGGTTDHVYNMWHTEMLITRKLAEYYYFPGEFVAIPAYEWTGSAAAHCTRDGGPWGHVNPLYLEEDGDLDFYTPIDAAGPGGTLARLWETFAGQKIIAPPHHVADNAHPFNWDFFNAEFIPVIEIFQDLRGSGEKPWAPGVTNYLHREEGYWAVPELRNGKRFGFIASADHSGHARAGILTTELTRSGLYEGLTARRCFATTNIGLRLSFTANGRPAGSDLPCSEAAFSLQVTAAEEIAEVQIVRNGEEWSQQPVAAPTCALDWTATRETAGEFWYCRVLFTNGEIAWSSPIWLDPMES